MKRSVIIVSSIAGAGALLSVLLWPAKPSFPPIANGVYFGELRGTDGKPESHVPIYVESIAKTSSLLVVPLEIGVSPELHPLVPLEGRSDRNEPIVVRLKSTSVTLAGRAESDGFAGTIEPLGTWELHPLNPKTLRENTTLLQTSVELPRWLKVKAQSAVSSTELQQLRETFTREKDRLKGLEDLLGNEKLLKEKSQARREALASEISLVTEKKRKLAEDLRSSLDNISVLHRIRLDGQAIEVARRILKREERWFDGNAGGETGDESLEEQLAANDKVDMQNLNAAAKKAEEIQQIRRSLAEEQSQLQILTSEYQRKIVHHAAPGGM